jgi:hypothetical protein
MATATAAEQGLRSVAADARDEEERLTAAIRNAPQDRCPRIVALGDDLLAGTGPDRLEWMLTAFTTGFCAPAGDGPPRRKETGGERKQCP